MKQTIVAKKYFQDKVILLLLTLNIFLAFLASVIIILRLSTNVGEGYIIQYRSNLIIGGFKTGSVLDFVCFIIFAVFVVAFHLVLSMRIYKIRRQFSVAILSTGALLLVLVLIVSNALLVLR